MTTFKKMFKNTVQVHCIHGYKCITQRQEKVTTQAESELERRENKPSGTKDYIQNCPQ